MRRCPRLPFLLLVCAAAASAADLSELGGKPVQPVSIDLGLLPIGAVLGSTEVFSTTDCIPGNKASMADCSGVDRAGRVYGFFDRVLMRVSVGEAADAAVHLPGNVSIGQDFNSAVAAVGTAMRAKLTISVVHDGDTVASTSSIFQSSAGAKYSVELISTRDGRLAESVQRTDW